MRKLFVVMTVLAVGYSVLCYLDYKRHRTKPAVEMMASLYPTMGKGPVNVVVFQDLRCPGCKYFYDEMYPELKKRYFSKGKATYSAIPLAFLSESDKAAHVALSVYYVNVRHFFSYLEVLYDKYSWKKPDNMKDLMSKAQLVKGIDLSAVQRNVRRLQTRNILQRNFQEAKRVMDKVATPGIFVDGVDMSENSLQELITHIDRKIWEKRGQ